MKTNAQRLAMTGSLSTYAAAGAQRNGRTGGVESPRIFLIMLTALALVMGTMVPAAFADSASDASTGSGSGTAETSDTTGIFAGGSGTTEDPYTIETAAQLAAFRDAVNAGTTYEGDTIKLTADVDISGSEWKPIGAGASQGSGAASSSTPFKGTFDGSSKTVTGLTITSTTSPSNALGFFGVLDGAQVKNLTLTAVNINVPTSELAGGIAGLAVNNSTLSTVHVEGSISGASNIGGIVGSMTKSGTIINSQNAATVSGTGSNIGGIVGAASGSSLQNEMRITTSANNGAVSGAENVGGIVGLSAARVSFSPNMGSVTASTGPVGGIVGEQTNYGAIISNANSGAVTNTSSNGAETGGIVGLVDYNGAGTAYAASTPIAVRNNTNTATVKGGETAGGIVGSMYSAGTVTGNINKAPAVSATTYAAGIVGSLQEPQSATAKNLPSTVTEGITVEKNVSITPEADLAATNKALFAANNTDPAKFTVADNSTTLGANVPEATPDTPSSDDPNTTPAAANPDGSSITGSAVGSPIDGSATQQAGTADPTAAEDNATQTGASLQQTGDDLLRVEGVAAVLALTAGATLLIVRRRSL